MSNTFITRLAGVAENNDLRKFGELRLPCYGDESSKAFGVNNENGIISCMNKPVVYNIIGDVTFTDGTKSLDSTVGTNVIKRIVTNKDFILQCLNKYNIFSLKLTQGEGNLNVKSDFDISALGILPSLTKLEVRGCQGDLNGTVRKAKQLSSLIVAQTNVALSIDSIPTEIKYLSLGNATNITGSIADLKRFNLQDMKDWAQVINNTIISGDLADIPSSVCYINAPNNPLIWTKGKRANASLLAINMNLQNGFATVADVDNMFIDQSTCTYNGNTLPDNHGGSVHAINVKCVQSYTPSSEAQTAIRKVYAKGITEIKVNNISMEQYK